MGFRVRGLLRFPESPAGVGSRLENLRGCGGRPAWCDASPRPGTADRVLHRKNSCVRLLGSKTLCVFDVFMHFYVKTRWFFVIFMAGALPRAGVVAGGLAAQQATSWLPAGHLPAASRLQPATIQCRIIIPGRCRGWWGCLPPAAGHQLARPASQPCRPAILPDYPLRLVWWWVGPVRPDSQSNGPASIIKLNLVICIMYFVLVLCCVYYVLCALCGVLCIVCHVLCTLYDALCIMYYVLPVIHSHTWAFGFVASSGL